MQSTPCCVTWRAWREELNATGILSQEGTYLLETAFCALLELLSKLCELLFQVRNFILEPIDFFLQLSHSVAVNGTFRSVRLDL